MIPDEVRQLVEHMEWADARVWRTVAALPAAAADRRLRELLHHIHVVQRVFLQTWRGEPVEAPEVDAFRDPGDLREWGRGYHRELAAFVADLDDEALDRPVELPWARVPDDPESEAHPTDLRQCLLQVTSHSAYHRGQVNTRIRELGGEPPLVDFIAWAWAGRPAPRWPSAPDGGR